MKKFISLLIVSITAIFIFSGCNSKIATFEYSYPGKAKATLKYFDGDESISSISVKKDKVLTINYDFKVSKGKLSIKLYDSDKNVVMNVDSSEKGSKEIKASEKTTYKLKIEGTKAAGSYDVTWKIK